MVLSSLMTISLIIDSTPPLDANVSTKDSQSNQSRSNRHYQQNFSRKIRKVCLGETWNGYEFNEGEKLKGCAKGVQTKNRFVTY